MNTALSVLALLIALGTAAFVLVDRRRARPGDGADVTDLPADALGLRHEVAALRAEGAMSLRNLAVVRYDAFEPGSHGASGGALSWSLALLDDHGDGAVITSIHGRTEARTYAKAITAWTCEQPMSPEESSAVDRARHG